MRKLVEFVIDEPVRLVNGDVAKPGKLYRYPMAMLEREPTPWREPNRNSSEVGTRIHSLLRAIGLQPVHGCSCRSIERRLNGMDVRSIDVDETAAMIVKSMQAHYKMPMKKIVRQVWNAMALVCLKCIPAAILPMLSRNLVRMAIWMETRREVQVREARTLSVASDDRRPRVIGKVSRRKRARAS